MVSQYKLNHSGDVTERGNENTLNLGYDSAQESEGTSSGDSSSDAPEEEVVSASGDKNTAVVRNRRRRPRGKRAHRRRSRRKKKMGTNGRDGAGPYAGAANGSSIQAGSDLSGRRNRSSSALPGDDRTRTLPGRPKSGIESRQRRVGTQDIALSGDRKPILLNDFKAKITIAVSNKNKAGQADRGQVMYCPNTEEKGVQPSDNGENVTEGGLKRTTIPLRLMRRRGRMPLPFRLIRQNTWCQGDTLSSPRQRTWSDGYKLDSANLTGVGNAMKHNYPGPANLSTISLTIPTQVAHNNHPRTPKQPAAATTTHYAPSTTEPAQVENYKNTSVRLGPHSVEKYLALRAVRSGLQDRYSTSLTRANNNRTLFDPVEFLAKESTDRQTLGKAGTQTGQPKRPRSILRRSPRDRALESGRKTVRFDLPPPSQLVFPVDDRES